MRTLKNYRQGEVLILGQKGLNGALDLPKGWQKKAKLVPGGVIIEGELAGHKHVVTNGKLFEHPTNKDLMVLEAEDGCVVTHPEHGPVKMPKGTYEIKIQREYQEGQARKVKD